MKALILEEITTSELEKHIDNIKIAVVPTGSYEQHGPNTTFATDTVRAYEIAKLLGVKYGKDLLICPPVGYGISPHHMKFTGTITLSIETYVSVMMDIAWSLKKHGIKKILFLTGHGGNRFALGTVITKIKMEYNIDAFWAGTGSGLVKDLLDKKGCSAIRGHACEAETSQSLYLAPWLVKEDKLEKGKLIKDNKYIIKEIVRDGGVFWDFSDITENGALGDATKSNIELGKEITDLVIERLSDMIDRIIL